MIEGLESVLHGSGQPGLPELRLLLRDLLRGRAESARWIDQAALRPQKRRVFRLRFETRDGRTLSWIVKRLSPASALRNEMVVRRWLPAVGLEQGAPALLGAVSARGGGCVWHVYEDLGPCELDPGHPDREKVSAAVELMARLHTRFSGHALTGEVRLHGGDLGIHFVDTSLRDAIAGLEAWDARPERRALRDRLLDRIQDLLDDLPRRAEALAEVAGGETLLHGDLWAINVLVGAAPGGARARFIDWDHAAAGPLTYDLSTFLLRFPPPHRRWILDLYAQAVADAGWRLPPAGDLNLVFETHEHARFASRVIWPAIALVVDRAGWGEETLEEIEQWFRDFRPVLPGRDVERTSPADATAAGGEAAPAAGQ